MAKPNSRGNTPNDGKRPEQQPKVSNKGRAPVPTPVVPPLQATRKGAQEEKLDPPAVEKAVLDRISGHLQGLIPFDYRGFWPEIKKKLELQQMLKERMEQQERDSKATVAMSGHNGSCTVDSESRGGKIARSRSEMSSAGAAGGRIGSAGLGLVDEVSQSVLTPRHSVMDLDFEALTLYPCPSRLEEYTEEMELIAIATEDFIMYTRVQQLVIKGSALIDEVSKVMDGLFTGLENWLSTEHRWHMTNVTDLLHKIIVQASEGETRLETDITVPPGEKFVVPIHDFEDDASSICTIAPRS